MKRIVWAAALLSTALAGATEPDATIEWPHVGSGQTHTKYSAAGDITVANVDELEIVWQWEPNEMPLEEYGTRPGPFQATPIMVGGVLYLSTMYTRVAALDAETGRELWTFDPRAYEGGPKGAGPTGFKHRGIAWWSAGDDARIFLNSRDRLYAIDAATGELDAGFGGSGSVLLTEGHGRPVTRYEFEPDLAAGGVRGPGHRGKSHSRSVAAKVRPPWNRAGVRRAHGRASLGVLHPSRNRAMTSVRTPGRTNRGATPATPTCGG